MAQIMKLWWRVMTSLYHSHKKRKDSLETRAVLLIFSFELLYLLWSYREYIKVVRNDDFWEELLSEKDFEAVLATSCCHDHDSNASEAVQKITTDQKDYHKHSLCVIVCWVATIYQSLAVKKNVVTKTPPT